MNATEYLSKLPTNEPTTFLIARAVKDEATPFFHFEYRSTPARSAWEWLCQDGSGARFGDRYIVINDDHPPVDPSGTWCQWYEKGRLTSVMVTTEADLHLLYRPEQAARMIEYYDRKVRKMEGII